MKTRKTKTLRFTVINNETADEYIEATLTIKYKYSVNNGYRVNTKVFQKSITYNENKHLYYGLKMGFKEAIEFTKWICWVYGDLIANNIDEYYED